MSRTALGRALGVVALLAAAAGAGVARGQQVSGELFHDRDADGIRDAGEEALPGIGVRLYGQLDAGGTFDQTLATDPGGQFLFAPGDGCFLIDVEDPPDWRRTQARVDERNDGDPGYDRPVGLRRFGGATGLLDRLLSGSLNYSAMGDSIAANFNSCFDTGSFFYSGEVRNRLACVNPAATVTLDTAAILGEHCDDLLVDETGETNNVFRIIEAQPDLVTISIIGNDLLNDEPGPTPTQTEINRFVAELLDSRQNIQEALSSLVSEIPQATVELNTLYDNLADDCNSNDNHRQWLPILAQMLRDLAWGQARRVTNAEVYSDFAHEDLLSGCAGFQNEICQFFDGIHPLHTGYQVIREKVWESLNGVNLGPRDALAASSISGADQGYLRRVLRLFPSTWEERNGGSVSDPQNAFDDADGGLGATVGLGIGSEEVRFGGFPDYFDEVEPVKVVAGVRYRTTGTVTDDFYRVEASVDGAFRPAPGHAYTATDWNYYTPIVGGGGPDAPAEAPDYSAAELLVVPDVATYRSVSATLTKNPVVSADGRGYDWPAVTLQELGTTEIRLAAAPVAGTPGDAFDVVVDAVWLDVYGVEKTRPPEISGVRVDENGSGGLDVSFDELVGSELYNVYFGDLGELVSNGGYTHADPVLGSSFCDATTVPAGAGRLQSAIPAAQVPAGSAYVLVTGRIDAVESPAGTASNGAERDRSQNVCP